MNKILITGACGYLGARLCKHLAEAGYKVTAFTSHNASVKSEWALLMDEIIVGDICDEATVSNLASRDFNVVIHLISLDHHKSESSPNFVSSINVMPTWNLLDTFTKNGLNKFIYFSTIHVYGNLSTGTIDENYPSNPINTYGLTHFLSERICNYYNNKTDTECINIRLSNSYGSPIFSKNNCWWLVINDLCKTAINSNEIRLTSDGSPQRDFIHGYDVARAVEILIKSKENNEKNTFHIASGETLTILDLAYKVKNVFDQRYNKNIKIILPNGVVSENPQVLKSRKNFSIDTKNIRQLGFKQNISIDEGISELFSYLENVKSFSTNN